MIQAQFLIDQHFLVLDIKKLKKIMSGNPHPPKRQNDVIKDKSIYESSLRNCFLDGHIQSVSWSLAEFRHNKIVQSPHENYFNVCRQHKEK